VRLATTNLTEMPPPWTAAFWVKREADSSGAALWSSTTHAIKLEQWGDTHRVGITKFAPHGFDRYFDCTAPLNAWAHLAVVATDSETRVYLDGKLHGTMPATINLGLSWLGSSQGYVEHASAILDEVKVFDQALTDAQVAELAGSRGSRIVLFCDDWALSNTGFARAPSAAAFARNIARWFTGGAPGNFLVYSANFGLTESALAKTMTDAGHRWTVSTSGPFTPEALAAYDGVFLLGDQADTNVLTTYVARGGSVYVGGIGDFDANRWNPFLNAYGLRFGSAFTLTNTVPMSSPHPLLEGVSSLYIAGPIAASVVDGTNPRTKVLCSFGGQGLIAIYE
jgi:hypothetical protein